MGFLKFLSFYYYISSEKRTISLNARDKISCSYVSFILVTFILKEECSMKINKHWIFALNLFVIIVFITKT